MDYSQPLIPADSMKQFLEELGWSYQGMCGCQDNKQVYAHPDYPAIRMWLTLDGNRLEVRRVYGVDSQIKGIGGPHNYQAVYNYWIAELTRLHGLI